MSMQIILSKLQPRQPGKNKLRMKHIIDEENIAMQWSMSVNVYEWGVGFS